MAKGKYEYWLTKDGLTLIAGWARNGLTDEQIAKNIGIHCGTLYDWKKKHAEISEALKKTKEIADTEVENALFRRATGYDYTEETRERRFDKITGEYELVTTKTVKKHMPPDTAAAIIWLKNRRPGQWREKGQEAQNTDGVVIVNDAPG